MRVTLYADGDIPTTPTEDLVTAAGAIMHELSRVKAEPERRGIVIAGLIPEYVVACVEKTATTMPEGV